MADYLPQDNALLAGWARAFNSNIAAAPAEYGLKEDDAAAIGNAVEAFLQAYAAARTRQTRTQLDVLARNQAKKVMIKTVRQYVRRIKADATVPVERKADLHLRQPGAIRAAVPPPVTRPVLHALPDAPLRHRMRYQDVLSQRRGKPQGVVGLQLFCHVGEREPEDPLAARFVRLVTRQMHPVDFTPQQKGQTAFYYGRWQTATGETGPWSQIVSLTVGG